VLKTYSLILVILYSIALTIVCLIKIEGLNKAGISFGDKIFHSLSYVVLTFLWFNTLFNKFKLNKSKALTYAVIVSILFGIIIEILQGTLTTYRSADINDVLANSLGVMLTAVVIKIKNKYYIK
jgi:VanZ family protein